MRWSRTGWRPRPISATSHSPMSCGCSAARTQAFSLVPVSARRLKRCYAGPLRRRGPPPNNRLKEDGLCPYVLPPLPERLTLQTTQRIFLAAVGRGFRPVGTLSLYAAFNTKTGEVLGKTAARHTSAEFVAFLADIV